MRSIWRLTLYFIVVILLLGDWTSRLPPPSQTSGALLLKHTCTAASVIIYGTVTSTINFLTAQKFTFLREHLELGVKMFTQNDIKLHSNTASETNFK